MAGELAAEWIKIPDGNGNLQKVWVRDSTARRDVAQLQTDLAQLQTDVGGLVIPDPSDTAPQMDGTAAAGSSADYSRADHVHPTDTSRQAALSAAQLAAVNSGITAAKVVAYDTIEVPTKTSELVNDSGFITSAPVASVNGQTGAVSLDASDVGALPDNTAIPTKTSDLTNDSGFITQSAIPSVPAASAAMPAMDGTASAGTSTSWSRGDHVHPHDTSKQDALSAVQLSAVNSGVTAAKVAEWDAIEVPTKTSELTNDSGYITAAAIPAVPTKTSELTNDSGFITTAAVPDPSSAIPQMDGTAAAGSSADYARADHVHPSDTAKQDALSQSQLDVWKVNDPSVLCSVTPIQVTPTNGTNNPTLGNTYYYKIGHRVHVHIGATGYTSGQTVIVFTLPAGYVPLTNVGFVCGGSSYTTYSRIRVNGADTTTPGVVNVNPSGGGILADFEFDAFA